MRVLLIYTNREQSPYPVLPLGLAYVDASLRQRGIETRLLDLCFAKDAAQVARDAVQTFKPDCIGLSIRNIDNLTYDAPVRYLPAIRPIVDACRQAFHAPIVAGGSGFSIFPQAILRFLDLQIGIVGEGEEAFPLWLASGDPHRVPGVVTNRDSPGDRQPPARVRDLDALPIPTRDRAVSRTYELAGSAVNVQTKRGCPFRCLYCNYPVIEGRDVRLRSPQNVGEELERLARAGVKKIHFVDAVFTYPPDHAAAICEEILRRRLDLHWVCGANPSSLSPELACLMRRAGCSGVELGIDAANDGMLHRLRKGFTLDDVAACSEGCCQARLPFLFHLIFGGPGETATTIEETLTAIGKMRATAVTYSFGLRIFPATGLAEVLQQEGGAFSDDDLLEPRFYLSPELAPKMMERVLNHARREPTWLAPRQRDSAIAKAIMRLGTRLGTTGPAWRHAAVGAPIKRAVAVVKAARTKRSVARA